jgi:cyclophilin family peptidyl-prolyl cis-trans isomerase
MLFRSILVFVALLCPLTAFAEEGEQPQTLPLVVMETSMGSFKIEVFDKEAPLSAENFRDYVRQGFYDKLIFHRVIPRFMAQGGGFEPGMKRRNPTRQPVPNEATNGKKNKRGTVAMARTRNIHSATSQFFINVVDNISLDNRGTMPHEFGYAVFGKIVEGMDVVDKIVNTPTTMVGQYRNVPKKEVLIIKAYEEKQ